MPEKVYKSKTVLQEGVPIGVKALAYLAKKKQAADVAKEIADIRGEIEPYLLKHFVTDAKGSKYCIVEHAGTKVEMKHQRSTGSVFNEVEAKDIIDKLPKEIKEQVLETITIVRQDILESLIMQGDISDAVAKKLYTPRESFSFLVKKAK